MAGEIAQSLLYEKIIIYNFAIELAKSLFCMKSQYHALDFWNAMMKTIRSTIITMLCFIAPTVFFQATAFNTTLTASSDTAGKNSDPEPKAKAGFKIKKVIIDAGHGGHDSGCLGRYSKEKHIALKIALLTGHYIAQQFPDVEVIFTRSDDTFIPLYERAAIANRNNADLFISIHCNYIPNASGVKGTETYVMGLHTAEHNLEVAKRENASILLEDNYEQNYDFDPNSPEGHIMLSMFQNAFLEQSIAFADMVESEMHQSSGRKTRGVRQAGFVVLKATTMPSVLIETGYLSNGTEEGYLADEAGQHEVAQSILNAFNRYKLTMEGNADNIRPIVVDLPPVVNVNKQPVEKIVNKKPEPVPAPKPEMAAASHVPAVTPAAIQEITPAGFSFCVQLAASSTPLDLNQGKWSSVGETVEVIQEDGKYKYQVRNFTTFGAANERKARLKHLGFADAFIVAYQGSQKVSLQVARQQTGE